MISRILFLILSCLATHKAHAQAHAQMPMRVIHVFVALADNTYQGIIPVPPAIGNGDDPAQNLYWGCDEGMKSIFRKSSNWKLLQTRSNPSSAVLERLVFRHAVNGAYLVADAYRGRQIRQATIDFLSSSAGTKTEKIIVAVNKRPIELNIAGSADLVAYIGHDGLMDFSLDPSPSLQGHSGKPAIVLCCKSEDYFACPLRAAGARPLLLTTQLMYPGSFILHAALEGWLRGEQPQAIRERAARAYAANQGISMKAARGVFTAEAQASAPSNVKSTSK